MSDRLTILLSELCTFEEVDGALPLILEIVLVAEEHVGCLRARILLHFVKPILHSLERVRATKK